MGEGTMNDQNGKNWGFLALDPSLECSWTFTTPLVIHDTAEAYDGILETTEALFGTLNSFIRPTRVEYAVGSLPEKRPLADIFNTESGTSVSVSREQVFCRDGVTFYDLVESLEGSTSVGSEARFLSLVKFTEIAVAIMLEDGERMITRDSPEARLWNRKPLDEQPTIDPLRFEVRLARSSQATGESGRGVQITVATATDIWFESTSLGRQNRSRLSSFFDRLQSALRVNSISCRSNRYPDAQLRDLV